jgi:hypothetical protein
LSHLEEKRRNKSKRFASLGVHVVIDEGDDSGPDGGGARGSSDLFDNSLGHDVDLGTKSRDVRECVALRVVISRRR